MTAGVSVEAAWLKELRETISSRKLWAFVFLISLLPLCLPATAIGFLGLTRVLASGCVYFGLGVLLGFIGFIVAELAQENTWLARQWRHRRELADLRTLTPAEKQVLRGYIDRNTKTQYFQLEDGVVSGLQRCGFLYRPTSMGRMVSGFAFNIKPWVWNYLKAHPELLGGPEDDPEVV
jgi:hypothetical protein